MGDSKLDDTVGRTVPDPQRAFARCSNGLERGDEALIIAYDRELEAFRVEPLTKSKDEERHG